jgi:hypothetical protein
VKLYCYNLECSNEPQRTLSGSFALHSHMASVATGHHVSKAIEISTHLFSRPRPPPVPELRFDSHVFLHIFLLYCSIMSIVFLYRAKVRPGFKHHFLFGFVTQLIASLLQLLAMINFPRVFSNSVFGYRVNYTVI